jgi:tRNA threonylcarbamoyladenosine biosynthesis protein TsaB
MIILTIRTDKPEAEIGLYDGQKQLAYMKWEAHRQLLTTINGKIKELLKQAGKDLNQLEGIACFKGPGSFTGLRIGLSVANALAYAEDIAIVSSKSEAWIKKGIKALLSGKNERIALPEYGGPAKTTQPRK